ncbi:UNVERIFIED_CONTAM: hypothetical protein Sradi_4130800, partial [Sesamum radiatum]
MAPHSESLVFMEIPLPLLITPASPTVMVSPMSFAAGPVPSGSTPLCLPTMSLPSLTNASPSASSDVPVAPLHQ